MKDQRTDLEVLAAFRAAGQGHVLRWWDELDAQARARLMEQLRAVDLDQLRTLITDACEGRLNPPETSQPELPDYVRLPRTPEEKADRDRARAAGEELLRAGKVAVVMVAGGQGTRLRYDPPKGTFPVGPVSGHSLFQIHAERILATRRRYGRPIPWYIMTSDATDHPTQEYFQRAGWLGLPRDEVRFFRQRNMPVLVAPFSRADGCAAEALLEHGPTAGRVPGKDFHIALAAKDEILFSPNGHGGTLPALVESGALDDMERRGIEEISYFQVDNCLVPAADPVFLGYHSLAKADMSSKMLRKRTPEEALGAFVRIAGVTRVIEYSDLTAGQKLEKTSDGRLLYELGSVAIHALRVDFVRREMRSGFTLPFHLARKRTACLDESGALVQPKPDEKNVLKFEAFIFDALRDTRRTAILEIRREEEFSPLKNASGDDSPESCKRHMSALFAGWLEQAGVKVPRRADGAPEFPIEISPLFALDAGELAAKVPRGLAVGGPIYLGPAR